MKSSIINSMMRNSRTFMILRSGSDNFNELQLFNEEIALNIFFCAVLILIGIFFEKKKFISVVGVFFVRPGTAYDAQSSSLQSRWYLEYYLCRVSTRFGSRRWRVPKPLSTIFFKVFLDNR